METCLATKAGKGLLQITQQWLVFSLATHCFRLPGWRLAVTFTMENPSISPNWDLCQTFSYRGRQCFQAGISMQANGQNGLQQGLLDFTGNPIRWLWTVLAVTMWNGAWMTIRARLSTMEGNAQQNGVSCRRSQKRQQASRWWKQPISRTLGKETWNCTFYINITCICVSYLHKSRCLTFCPSVYSSIQECVEYALPMSVYCICTPYPDASAHPCTCKVRSTTRIHHPSVCCTSQQAQRHRSYYRHPPGKICRLFGHLLSCFILLHSLFNVVT